MPHRLTSVDGVTYTWDAKGNLLSDGSSTYSYDHANRLTSFVQGANTYTFAYNGLGGRLRQTVNSAPTNYTLDLNASLTQVLADGSSIYLYGVGRIGEQQAGGWAYHLRDALGSVRQLAEAAGTITVTRAYQPFGSTLTTAGNAASSYGFTGEWTDTTGLVHLRARYYGPQWGRFFVKDPWKGSFRQPATRNAYTYVLNNPTLYTDPSGQRVAVDLGLYSRPGLTLALQITGVLSALRCGQTNAAQASMAISTRSVLSRPTQPIPPQTGNGTFLEWSSAQWDEIAHGADAIAAVIDIWMASFTAGTSVGGCIGGALVGGQVLEGCVIGYGLGTTMTFIPRNIANVFSSVGAYATVRSDLASGETQIGNGNHPIVIGEDSKVAVAAALLGWVDQDPLTSALLASYVVTQDQGWLPCLALCGPTTINR